MDGGATLQSARDLIESLPAGPERELLAELVETVRHGLDPIEAIDGLTRPALAECRRAERDYWLRRAYMCLPPDSTHSKTCKDLSAVARIFEATTWPRVRHYREPPMRLTEIQRALFLAMKAGAGPIPAWRQLTDVCNPCRITLQKNSGNMEPHKGRRMKDEDHQTG